MSHYNIGLLSLCPIAAWTPPRWHGGKVNINNLNKYLNTNIAEEPVLSPAGRDIDGVCRDYIKAAYVQSFDFLKTIFEKTLLKLYSPKANNMSNTSSTGYQVEWHGFLHRLYKLLLCVGL